MKYNSKAALDALVKVLEKEYVVKVDLTGGKYVGVSLDWDYTSNTLDADMPNVVTTALARFCPDGDPRPSDTPGNYEPPQYGALDLGATVDNTAPVSAADKAFIMAVVGVFLFYARMIDHTMLPAVTFISKKQSASTEKTLAATHKLLRYASSHRAHKVRFTACDM